jgi:hypothetical protein
VSVAEVVPSVNSSVMHTIWEVLTESI